MNGQQPQSGDNAANGGLAGPGGLIARCQQVGMGHVIGSRVGSGENQAISGEQQAQCWVRMRSPA